MTKEEFENTITPKVNHGIGGCVSPEMWRDIELVYMETNLGKIEVADCFWHHTGRWSSLVYVVKTAVESKERIAAAKKQLAAAEAELNAAQLALRSAKSEIYQREQVIIADTVAA